MERREAEAWKIRSSKIFSGPRGLGILFEGVCQPPVYPFGGTPKILPVCNVERPILGTNSGW